MTYPIIRMLVALGLLTQVWKSAHWSVALVLSLITVRIELQDLVLGNGYSRPK